MSVVLFAMATVAHPKMCVFVVLSSSFVLAPQTARAAPQPNVPTEQSTNQNAPEPVAQPQEGVPGQQKPPPPHKALKSPEQQAWQILNAACTGDKTSDRAMAIRILGLMPNDAAALGLATKALKDPKPEVRAAAAAALGDMHSWKSIPKLRIAMDDQDPTVALAAAHSLQLMHDNSAYEVYYEVLNGERKASRGLIASKTSLLSDPKKLAQLGFEEGIGFIPFAGIGWGAVKAITKDDTSPIRAAAAKVLAKDPDPATTKALTDAAGDKSWLVRAAALEALAKRGDPSVLDTVKLYLLDEKDIVRYTAAAAVLRLTAIQRVGAMPRQKTQRTRNKPTMP